MGKRVGVKWTELGVTTGIFDAVQFSFAFIISVRELKNSSL